MKKERIIWIDWMKVIGMYFIIVGHIFPVGHNYIYVFSVPLFFYVSGFLCKRESENILFWKKLFKSLILPCLLICIIWLIYDTVTQLRLGIFCWENILLRIKNWLLGMHGYRMKGGGLGMCWFIYTLMICKIIYQYSKSNILIHGAILASCMVTAFIYNCSNSHLCNSVLNASLAYPFFYGGVF